MSEREQLTTVIQAMDEIYVSGIYKTVMETLAEMIRRQHEEDERDLQIVNETMARIESGEEETVSLSADEYKTLLIDAGHIKI